MSRGHHLQITALGYTPGKKRGRLLLLYDYLDRLGLSEEVEQVTYHGSTYRLIRAIEAASSDTTQRMIWGSSDHLFFLAVALLRQGEMIHSALHLLHLDAG